MSNILIPIKDKNLENFKSLLLELAEKEELAVFVGVEEKNLEKLGGFEDCQNIQIISYQDGSNAEEMINDLHKYAGADSLLILRRPITIEEISKFLNCKLQVATCKVNRSKFKNAMFTFWQVILKTFLGIKEYEGDTSAIFLSEEISTVAYQSGNLSYSSRANRWRGIIQETIPVKGEPEKKEIDKKSVLKYSLIASWVLLFAIAVTTAVCLTVNVGVIVGLLLVCLDIICVAISFLTIIMAIFNTRVGSKKIGTAVSNK